MYSYIVKQFSAMNFSFKYNITVSCVKNEVLKSSRSNKWVSNPSNEIDTIPLEENGWDIAQGEWGE